MNFEDLQQFVVVKRPTSVRKNIVDMTTVELREAALVRKDAPKHGHVRVFVKLSQLRLEGATFNVPSEKVEAAEETLKTAIIEGNFDKALEAAQQRLIQKQAKDTPKPVEPEPAPVSTASEEETLQEAVAVFQRKYTSDELIMMEAGDYLL